MESLLRVDKSKAMLPSEQYEEIRNKIYKIDEHLPWDLHPNQINAQNIHRNRLVKKLKALIDSPEGQEEKLPFII